MAEQKGEVAESIECLLQFAGYQPEEDKVVKTPEGNGMKAAQKTGKKTGKRKQNTPQKQLDAAWRKLTHLGWATYVNLSDYAEESVTNGPVDKLEIGKSYFIFPIVEENDDADAIRDFIDENEIEQPTISCDGDDLYLNGFRIEKNGVVVIHEDGTVKMDFSEFAKAVATMPDVNQ